MAALNRIPTAELGHPGLPGEVERTTAEKRSLILCEDADPSVRRDLERFFARLVPDGDAIFGHTAEGPDDMPAHVRTILTQNSLTIPVDGGRCDLGTWQGIFLWEHRTSPHRRRITVSIVGES